MGTSGKTETFFVVASTDLQRSGIMTTRIREQLDRLSDLKAKCSLTISTVPLELPSGSPASDNRASDKPASARQASDKQGETPPEQTLEQQVQCVADRVTQMILTSRERKQLGAAKSARVSNA
jgi:hypothetical protein